jgi:hypothetical protein
MYMSGKNYILGIEIPGIKEMKGIESNPKK